MRRLGMLAAAVVVVLGASVSAQAQAPDAADAPALLIADEIFVTPERNLIARGNVEAFQGEVRLQAKEVFYNRATGTLDIEGPIILRDGPDVTILASEAELDTRLKSGLMLGARMVLDQRLELTAVQAQRVNDRYSQLYRTAVTACQVCDDGRPPLWQIRATRVVHDREERQLYFDNAQFRIRDVPVFYLPRLRLPDPTVDRYTGFLIPSLRTTSQLGTGLKIPYFIVIDPQRDLLLRPYISRKTRTLEFRYRQAFVDGTITADGAVSRDDQREGDTRAYFFGSGSFSLPRGFALNFDVELVSDDAYLQDYGITTKDRLDSAVTIQRVRRNALVTGTLVDYNSLRDTENNETIPSRVGDFEYRKRVFPDFAGGELRLTANAHSHFRTSSNDIVGRDVFRINLDADWLRSWQLPGGIDMQARIGTAADYFDVYQDSTSPGSARQISPRAALTLRYPLRKQEAGGAVQLLEPLVQLGWVGGDRLEIPNEESTSVEFDAGNLLSLSRFPTPDRRERGTTLAYGFNWARYAPGGPNFLLTAGQVLRRTADDAFTESSGLQSTASDFLVAGQMQLAGGTILTARTLFDESFDFTKAEVRGQGSIGKLVLSGSYLWQSEDRTPARPSAQISEITLDGGYRINDTWRTAADLRYDFDINRASAIGGSIAYQNECVAAVLQMDRNFNSSSTLEPTTIFSLTIELRGFSARRGTETYSRTCKT